MKRNSQVDLEGNEVEMAKNPSLDRVRREGTEKDRKHYIRFSSCPVGKMKGFHWYKLAHYDTDGNPLWYRDFDKPAVLLAVIPVATEQLKEEVIKEDTFPCWTKLDFQKLMMFWYGFGNIFALYLQFDHPDGKFSTIRPYSIDKHKYWESLIGKEITILVK